MVSLVFFGLSWNVSNLGDDVFLNFYLTSIAQIVGFLLCIPLLNGVGRKPVYVGSLFMGGVALLLTIFPVKYGSSGKSFSKTRVYKDVIKNSSKERRVNFKPNKVIHILCLNCIAFESFLHNSYFCLSADIEWITFSLSFVGMTGSSMAVASLFLYSTELFPTVVRNSGLGIANLCACIGGIIAPYIPDLVLSLYMFLTSIVISYLPRCQLCVGCKIYNN